MGTRALLAGTVTGIVLLVGLAVGVANLSAFASAPNSGPALAEDQAPTAPDCGHDWATITSPNLGTQDNDLEGIDARSNTNAWAVGSFADVNADQTLIEHWDGTSWNVVASPDVGTNANHLYDLASVSANDVWAVGEYTNGSGTSRTLTEHWDGTSWSVIPSPNNGTGDNGLQAVTAIATNDVWAVGRHNVSGQARTLTEHWDGTQWSLVSSANVASAANYLNGVSASATNDVWAAGYSYSTTGSTGVLVEHWDGTSWSIAPALNPTNSHAFLNDVTALSGTNVWVVGDYISLSDGVEHTLAEHWNGTIWAIVSSPSPGPNYNAFSGVSAVTGTNIWAVGYYVSATGANHTLVEFWDGTSWTTVPASNPPAGDTLVAVDARSGNDVWAVGYNNMPSGIARTLTERYNPCSGTPTPSPTPLACTLQFEDVPNPSTFYSFIECLACKGIISGYSCGSPGEFCNPAHDPYFRPNNNVTRGQIAKIIALSAAINNPVNGQSFEDVSPGTTFYTYTEQLYALGVMNGYQCGGPGETCIPPNNRPYFRPNANATRGQLAKIDFNTAGYLDTPTGQTFEDVPPGSTFYTYTQRLTSRGVMNGYACNNPEPCVPPANRPYFRPNANVTRGQTSKIADNTFYPNCQASDDSPLASIREYEGR